MKSIRLSISPLIQRLRFLKDILASAKSSAHLSGHLTTLPKQIGRPESKVLA
jgi:hypothetical protein